jgi:hypothetical protein
MKKILYKYSYGLLLSSIVMTFLLLAACEDDDNLDQSVITEVRNYAASPDDTVVQTIQAGQWVVLMGENLSGVSQVLFGSVPATVNKTFFTDQSIVVQVPSIPFQLVPPSAVNEITLVSKSGVITFSINITGAPLITHLRNYAAAPNDTIVDAISPGQQINIIGYNLRNALNVTFQGIEVDLSNIIYTDSSAIVIAPEDFSSAGVSRANKISYTTSFGTGTYSNFNDPLWSLLAGGVSREKTWVLDLFAEGVSQKFNGHMYFAGHELRWDKQCATEGGNCWLWEANWQSWMPSPKDYGTMTFKLKGTPIDPTVTVVQKNLGGTKDGTFSGSYFLDVDAKTITFTEVVPLYSGWDQVWTKAYIISLTEDGLQLGFKNPGKDELTIFNYIPK